MYFVCFLLSHNKSALSLLCSTNDDNTYKFSLTILCLHKIIMKACVVSIDFLHVTVIFKSLLVTKLSYTNDLNWTIHLLEP